MTCQPGCQVARNAEMRCRIGAVRREVNFQNIVGSQSVIFRCRCSGSHFRIKHNYAVVRRSYTNFVLGTNHAERFNTAYLRFLNLKLLVAVIKHGAYRSHHNGLSCGHIGRAAHNLYRAVAIAQVNCSYVQVVAVGMFLASEHFSYNYSTESAFYRFYFFHRPGLQTYGSQHC